VVAGRCAALLLWAAVAAAPACANAPAGPAAEATSATSAAPSVLLAQAQAAAPAPPEQRPRIALVLSGGGARGFAHVGVLRVLERLRVPVDMIVGASMGAVVGGAYAAGRSADELERFARDTDWGAVTADRPQRGDLSYRRKEDDIEIPSRIEFGLRLDGVLGPPAAVGNAAVEAALARLLPPALHEVKASELALPFRAVATDLLSGELVELAQTPLLPSLRASMAVPGVFAPVRLAERLVVDGGLVRNLPVDLARAMGAQVVIAVNVGTPLAGEGELGSAIGVARQMLNILTEQNVQRSLKELGPLDILIAPDLRAVSFMDFRAAGTAIAAGEAAAWALAGPLSAHAVSPDRYAAWAAGRSAPRHAGEAPRPLARLEVQSTPNAGGAALAAETGLEPGQGITLADARRAASRLFGRGDFERVDVALRDTAVGRELLIVPTEAAWARSRVRVGLELSSDFRDDHRFTLAAMHVFGWLNRWGGELRTVGRIGSRRSLGTQWWQPLAPGAPWYGVASLGYDSESRDFFASGRAVARASVISTSLTLGAGRQLGNAGDLRVGITRSVGRGRILLPKPPTDDPRDFTETLHFATLRVDTLEPLAFPTRGVLLAARWQQFPAERAGLPSLAQSQLAGMVAFRLGEWGGHLYGEWARSPAGFAPLELGGFLRLTGTPRESISGAAVVLARAVLARRVGEMPAGLGGAVRIGLSLEAGEGFAPGEQVSAGRLRPAGSAFVSVDTRFGPAYLATGATRGSGATLYVFVGPFW
jgi:NTE family protein